MTCNKQRAIKYFWPIVVLPKMINRNVIIFKIDINEKQMNESLHKISPMSMADWQTKLKKIDSMK